jgi:hypothetical protein
MGIRMIRQPNSNYKVRSGTNYYSPDDVELTNSLGVIDRDMPASMVNLEYGKINMEYLVSAKDMEKESTSGVYNTVSNIDDIIPFRYAYGGQDGYVVGKGTELNNTVENGKFKIDSGRVVLQGVETDIDANGVSFDIDYSAQKRYYAIYYEVNLTTQSTEIKLTPYSDKDYPIVKYGDDLTTDPTGVSRLELYRFTATNGIIDNIQKVVKPIEYNVYALGGYDKSKGTVEERLTSLGFKKGTLVLGDGFMSSIQASVETNEIIRIGNRVSFIFKWSGVADDFFTNNTINNKYLIKVPSDFLPKESYSDYVGNGFATIYGLDEHANTTATIRSMGVSQDGNITINLSISPSITHVTYIALAYQYEAKPLIKGE